ncbi:MAG: L-lactate dehydrogenase [Lachnospiraceae bacterium]|nr:L-lactate dehydrogenase [Lachnospiraceae bacterium]
MRIDKRKVALVGCGMVGMSYAYSLLNQNACDELVLIDVNEKKAMGEAMDLNHGLAFAGLNMEIYAGEYRDCRDADLVVICAGVAQKPGETRLDLLKRNAAVFRSIIEPVTSSGFNGIFLVATNPVDVMTRITCALSGFNPRRVLGSGTALDTARLRYLLGQYLRVDPKNVHAYVMGEHGDSEFVPWSQAMVATQPILKICGERESENRISGEGVGGGTVSGICRETLQEIAEQVKGAAYQIIDAKQATYYGIGMALTRITRAVLGDENSVLTVSAMLRGEYGQREVFAGVPCVINGNGVRRVLELNLTEEELEMFSSSCRTLQESFEGVL